jgi:hypothetical protein
MVFSVTRAKRASSNAVIVTGSVAAAPAARHTSLSGRYSALRVASQK